MGVVTGKPMTREEALKILNIEEPEAKTNAEGERVETLESELIM